MDITRVKEIYGEIATIDITIDFQASPNPQYICEKLGECHVGIGLIEKLTIEVSQEMAVTQQALNNATVKYETDKETLLSKDEQIKSLPNIKDREATVNNLLKEQRSIIRDHDNSLTILNGLYKALSLKNKNLNRTNADIKAQIKIMEAQIRLGVPHANDPAARSLMEEMKKSISNRDAFQGAEAKEIIEEIVDPTASLDINNLLKQGGDGMSFSELLAEKASKEDDEEEDEEESDEVSQEMVDPMPQLNPEANGESPDEEEIFSDETPLDGLDNTASTTEEQADSSITIDLDEVIDQTKNQKGGIVEEKQQKAEQVEVADQKQEGHGAASPLDLDALIDELNIT